MTKATRLRVVKDPVLLRLSADDFETLRIVLTTARTRLALDGQTSPRLEQLSEVVEEGS